jgi:hypothetical protein
MAARFASRVFFKKLAVSISCSVAPNIIQVVYFPIFITDFEISLKNKKNRALL